MDPIRELRSNDSGQSLVEIALTLPLLLITLLGMVDVGRAFMYSTAATNAAREAALYAAKTSTDVGTIALRACNELGLSAYTTTVPSYSGDTATCDSGATVQCSPCPSAGQDVTITVRYQFSLISGYMFQRLLGRDSLTATGVASFRSLQ